MSIKSQKNNMRNISQLASMDLSYIHGEHESKPNGAKKEFLTKSAAFLRALGKDLCFTEMKVTTNPAGIAVSGEVTLMGMWSDGNGLYFQISKPVRSFNSFLYREIKHMKDYSGCQNQWLSCDIFANEEYSELINTMSALRKPSVSSEVRHVA